MGIRERHEHAAWARDAYLRKVEVGLRENGFIPTASYDIKTQTYAGLWGKNPIYAVFFRAYVDTNSKMLVFADTETEKISKLDYTKIIGYNLVAIKKGSGSTSGGFAYNVGNGLAMGTSTAEIIDWYKKSPLYSLWTILIIHHLKSSSIVAKRFLYILIHHTMRPL